MDIHGVTHGNCCVAMDIAIEFYGLPLNHDEFWWFWWLVIVILPMYSIYLYLLVMQCPDQTFGDLILLLNMARVFPFKKKVMFNNFIKLPEARW